MKDKKEESEGKGWCSRLFSVLSSRRLKVASKKGKKDVEMEFDYGKVDIENQEPG